MKFKKIVALIVFILVLISSVIGCNEVKEEKKTNELKVGLVTDEGGINDKSFNQSAYEGIKKASKDFGIKFKALESQKKEDYESNLEALIEDGCNLSIVVGYPMETAIQNVATNHENKRFAIIDTTVPSKNVESIIFKDEEGSFLMGIIAGKMTKSNKVGFIGGKDSATINKFAAGFTAGVKVVNKEAAANLLNKKTIKYADTFYDVNKGYEIAKDLIQNGCDVIYHAAGAAGIGMFNAVSEARKNGKEIWAIGVDKDQAVTILDEQTKKPKYKNIILSSMIKRVDGATYTVIKKLKEGNFKGGNNNINVLGIKENAIDIAESSSYNTPKNILELVEKYKKSIKDNKIKVPGKMEEVEQTQLLEIR